MGEVKLNKNQILELVKSQELVPSAGVRLLHELQEEEVDKIAVIGVSGQFPGAENIDRFWENLKQGIDSVTEIPDSRWSMEDCYDPNPKAPRKSYSKWCGLLEDMDKFDPMFFHISPREAELMDPQQRLFLMEAWKALEDSGNGRQGLDGKKCGVFVGFGGGDYTSVLRESNIDAEAFSFMGNSGAILASRIAYFLNLKGPAVALDTACSSSLTAIHLACESIRSGSSDIALAGGVMLFSTMDYMVMASKTNMLSPTGKCRAFDDQADGFVAGEAVGAVVLKSYKQAIHDGDHIYGVIVGSAINQDGKTNGITAPNGASQTQLICEVYDKFNIDPETIGYVEAHGTGTPLGDPIEVYALADAFKKYTERKQFCPIGSVKTNIGHTLIAAGISGFIKTLLCLKHRQLPPSLHVSTLNRHIDFEGSAFYVNQKLMDWTPSDSHPRRAAISAFGFSGTNCHMVIEEYVEKALPSTSESHGADKSNDYLFPISAHNQESFWANAQALLSFLDDEGTGNASALSYSLSTGRTHHAVRAVILASSLPELKHHLTELLKGNCTERHLGFPREAVVGEALPLVDHQSPDGIVRELAARYVQGELPDWRTLFTSDPLSYRRLSLPSYVFSLERHWVEKQAPEKETKSDGAVQRLHPMVVSNESTLVEQRYKVSFSPNDFYVKDHIVQDRQIIPGVAYLEAASFAARKSGVSNFNGLRNVTWLHPVDVAQEDVSMYLSFHVSPQGIQFAFHRALGADVKGEKLVQGEVHNVPIHEDEPIVQLKELKRDAVRIEGERCYEAFHTVGFRYGSSFQTVRELHYTDRHAVARLELPDVALEAASDYLLHPSLMDGALQTVIAFMHHKNPELQQSYVPFSLQNLNIYRPLTKHCEAVVSYDEVNSTSGGKRFHVTLCDHEGRVLVKMNDFLARPIVMPKAEVAYIKTRWEKQSLPTPGTVSSGSDLLIMICQDPEHTDYSLHDTASMYTITVIRGERFEQVNERLLRINLDNPEHIERLLKSYSGQMSRVSVIVEGERQPSVMSVKESAQLKTVPRVLFHLAKTLLTLEGPKNTAHRLVYVYADPMPIHKAVDGFFRALKLETNSLQCKTVELEPTARDQWVKKGLQELDEDSWASTVIRYRNDERYISGFEMSTPSPSTAPCEVVSDGVYVITGGLGELGFEVGHYTAQKGGHLALIGRSGLTTEKQKKLDLLKREGNQVSYYQGDVSDRVFVREVLNRIRVELGPIRGIVHAAGTHADKLLVDKTLETFDQVASSKVWASVWLDLETLEDSLDFFVLFGALAGVLGNAGQTDYCYGNAFLHHYAEYREQLRAAGKRQGKTLSIAWPLWKDGGMRPSEQQERYLQQKLGMLPLPKEQGVLQFEQLLLSDAVSIAMLYGQTDKAKRELERQIHAVKTSVSVEDHPLPAKSSDDHRDRLLAEELKAEICQVLKIPPGSIHLRTDLGTLGFDSLTFTELADRLNSRYELALTPALFFEYTTFNSLVNHLRSLGAGKGNADAEGVLAKPDVTQPYESDQQQPALALEESGHEYERFLPLESSASYVDRPEAAAAPTPGGYAPIAVIGMSGMMPQSDNLDDFWDKLAASRNLITEVPPERWSWEQYHGDPHRDKNKTNSKWGGFLNKVDLFDAEFFGISPKEAELMDPQQRLFLQCVWNAVEDAGYNIAELSGRKVGLFVGVSTSDYQELLRENEVDIEAYSALGVTHSVLANRISYLFNWHGQSEPIDTACSSSLVAIHRGVSLLQSGECELVVAGGINCLLSPSIYISFGKAGMLSPDGTCKTFDKDANGYVRGEGGGAIVLKPLDKAIRDGDHIYGVIRGSAVNHGGRTNSITSPNPSAQAEVIAEAVRKAGIEASSIGYIEAHGTGTSLGDPIEISGLKMAFAKNGAKEAVNEPFCALGSVKTNIGHLESAAGIAGVLKVLLAMKNKTIPGNVHYKELNPYIDLNGSPFYIAQHTTAWEAATDLSGRTLPRRAGVSSFGFSGINAHIILEEYVSPKRQEAAKRKMNTEGLYLFVLSSKKIDRLKEYAKTMQDFIKHRGDDLNLMDLTYTLQIGRQPFDERLAIVFGSKEELLLSLDDYLAGRGNLRVFAGRAVESGQLWDDLFADEAGSLHLTQLIKAARFDKLAKLWVGGIAIPWHELYSAKQPMRMSLPTYPFEPRSYWLKQKSSRQLLHLSYLPFDGPARTNEANRIIYAKTIYATDWLVSEHQVNGRRIVPGAYSLNLAAEAIRLAEPQAHYEIGEVIWQQPIWIHEASRQVELRVITRERGRSFEVISHDGTGQEVTHCRGEYTLKSAAGAASVKKRMSIRDIQRRCKLEIDGTEHYRLTEAVGLEFGSAFRTVERIRYHTDEALVYLTESARVDQAASVLPFLAIDGALQGISVFHQNKADLRPLLPFYLDSLAYTQSFSTPAYAYIQRVKDNQFDIALLDSNGEVGIMLSGVVVSEAKNERKISDMTFMPEWVEAAAVEEERPGDDVLIVVNEASRTLGEMILARCRNGRGRLLEAAALRRGASLAEVKQADRIYFLSGMQPLHEAVEEERFLRQAEEEGLLALFTLIKELDACGSEPLERRLTAVTGNVSRIVPTDQIQPSGGSLYGFLNAAVKEYDWLQGAYLDIEIQPDGTVPASTAEAIMSEKCGKELEEAGLRQGRRYVRRLYPVRLSAQEPSRFRQEGVYVILGGRGGIGTELARYLGRSYQAKVALIGRKPEHLLTAQEQQELESIASAGGQVKYVAADGGSEAEMKAAIREVEAQFGAVHGVIHSALVLNDKLIRNMTERELREVLRPKVDGSIGLYRALAGKPLDFVLYLSSVQSFTGMPGQSNYAAACTFKDSYSRYVESKENWRVRVIHWGYWGSVGVVAGREYQERMRRQGIHSIEPEEGMACIEQSLSNPVAQVVMLKADAPTLARMGIQSNRERVVLEPSIGEIHIGFEADEEEFLQIANDPQGFRELEAYSRARLLKVYQDAGLLRRAEEQWSLEELNRKMGIVPKYVRLARELLRILERGGYVQLDGEQVLVTAAAEKGALGVEERGDRLETEYAEVRSYVKLIDVCMSQYGELLRGEVEVTEVLFPDGNMDLVGNIYKGNPLSDYYNRKAAAWVRRYVEEARRLVKGRKLRLLEVGAGSWRQRRNRNRTGSLFGSKLPGEGRLDRQEA
ncbi:SDR family NAD(P)-dependent oxidoreductase [Paenibacillus bouchesdurhonensis]|uniref:SDR family NAD(P)-dependent oxidoreductase n=1 Tax=Paenibacillus bouchesdurhonensis TaxID=1870990 RepID=UPI000DA607E2|nr:SDR family NAD(P)-dependent oxidoreductase [Paenibacillus bouchesdurhonensis]